MVAALTGALMWRRRAEADKPMDQNCPLGSHWDEEQGVCVTDIVGDNYFTLLSPVSGESFAVGDQIPIIWEYTGRGGEFITASYHISGDPWGWTIFDTSNPSVPINATQVLYSVPIKSGYGNYAYFSPPFDIDINIRVGTATQWDVFSVNGIHIVAPIISAKIGG